MKKKIFGKKLARSQNARKALFRSLVSNLIVNGKIVTTKPKAKSVVPMVHKVIAKAKKGDVASRRKVLSILGNNSKSVDMLFNLIAKSVENKKIVSVKSRDLGPRRGDATDMVELSLSQPIIEEKVEVKSNKKDAKIVKKVVSKKLKTSKKSIEK